MEKRVALALLGIHEENPSEAQINNAYRSAIQLNHPDRFANNERLRRHAEEQCKLINEARIALLNDTWEPEEDYVHSRSSEACSGSSDCSSHQSKTSDQEWTTGTASLSTTPLLDIWETAVGFSVLGVLSLTVLMFVVTNIGTGILGAILGVVQIGYVCFQVVYAAAIYPSLFGIKPRIKSAAAASFWNCATGSFIFGPLWNSNLTKKKRGISHIVFIVLLVLWMAFWLFAFGYLLAVIR